MILDSYIIYSRYYLMGRKSLAPLIFLYLTFFSYLPYISSSLKKGYLDTREKRKKTRLINVRRAVLSLLTKKTKNALVADSWPVVLVSIITSPSPTALSTRRIKMHCVLRTMRARDARPRVRPYTLRTTHILG